MKSYTTLLNLYGLYTLNNESDNLTFGSQLINDGYRFILSKNQWSFLEQTKSFSTVSGQQFYTLPANCKKVKTCSIINGQIQYIPTEVTSLDDWNRLNRYTAVKSNIALNYFVKGQVQGGKQIGLYPIPSTPITNGFLVTYIMYIKDLATADYTSGTISVTNGDATVTGSGTSFTSAMAGRFLQVSQPNGDGIWYEIASVTNSTSLELVTPYDGSSQSGSSYTISDVGILPEEYQILPVYYAAWQYWLSRGDDSGRAAAYSQMFSDGLTMMSNDYSNKDANPVLSASAWDKNYLNPNNFPVA